MTRFSRFAGAAALIALLSLAVAVPVSSQAPTIVSLSTPVSSVVLTAISSTAAVNNQVTLTIPAPAGGLYNYVCMLSYHASQDGTATAQTNAVTTSTNFNAFGIKYSLTATATINYHEDFNFGTPGAGCVKSAAPGVATTFVSPSAGANIAFTWKATYFQAP